MATHANILACKIPLTEKPDEPWSMGLQRVRHDGVTKKVKVKVAQPCLTCCSPMDCSLPGSSVHGILQARILEWVVIPFFRESSLTHGLNSALQADSLPSESVENLLFE